MASQVSLLRGIYLSYLSIDLAVVREGVLKLFRGLVRFVLLSDERKEGNRNIIIRIGQVNCDSVACCYQKKN